MSRHRAPDGMRLIWVAAYTHVGLQRKIDRKIKNGYVIVGRVHRVSTDWIPKWGISMRRADRQT